MICSRCEQDLPAAEFYRDLRYKSGHSSYCKTCQKKQATGWRRDNPKAHHEHHYRYLFRRQFRRMIMMCHKCQRLMQVSTVVQQSNGRYARYQCIFCDKVIETLNDEILSPLPVPSKSAEQEIRGIAHKKKKLEAFKKLLGGK